MSHRQSKLLQSESSNVNDWLKWIKTSVFKGLQPSQRGRRKHQADHKTEALESRLLLSGIQLQDDFFQFQRPSSPSTELFLDVLANDTGNSLQITSVTNAPDSVTTSIQAADSNTVQLHGIVLSLNSSGTEFNELIELTYEVTDNGETYTAQAIVSLIDSANAPVLPPELPVVTDIVNVVESTTPFVIDVLANDDSSRSWSNLSLVSGSPSDGISTISIVSSGGSEAFEVTLGATPGAIESFRYEVTDGTETFEGVVTIFVENSNAPTVVSWSPTALDESYQYTPDELSSGAALRYYLDELISNDLGSNLIISEVLDLTADPSVAVTFQTDTNDNNRQYFEWTPLDDGQGQVLESIQMFQYTLQDSQDADPSLLEDYGILTIFVEDEAPEDLQLDPKIDRIYLQQTRSGNGYVVYDASAPVSGTDIEATIAIDDGYQSINTTERIFYEANGVGDFIPVDTTQAYYLNGWARSGGDGAGPFNPSNMQYFGFAQYDAEYRLILPIHVMRTAGATDTHLAYDLNVGDQYLYVDDATGWSQNVAGHTRSLAWYGEDLNPTDSNNPMVFEDYGYTRNVKQDNVNGIWGVGASVIQQVAHPTDPNRLVYRIELNTAWDGPVLSEGAAVRNAQIHGTYNYSNISGQAVGEEWTEYSAYIHGQMTGGLISSNKFRLGTEYIKPIVLANYHQFGTFGTSGDNQIEFRDFQFYKATEQTSQSSFTALFSGQTTGFASGPEYLFSDSYIPIDPTKSYELSAEIRAYDPDPAQGSTNKHLVGFASYDIDHLEIAPWHVASIQGSHTTVAVPITNGDTEIFVTDASGWDTGSTYHLRWIAVDGYTDSTGHVYTFDANGLGYTRLVEKGPGTSGAYSETGITAPNTGTNTSSYWRITLETPWSLGDVEANRNIRNSRSGSAYLYPLLPGLEVNNYIAESSEYSWDFLSQVVQGLNPYYNPHGHHFHHGTAFIKPLLVANILPSISDQLIPIRDVEVHLNDFQVTEVTPSFEGETYLIIDPLRNDLPEQNAQWVQISDVTQPKFGTATILPQSGVNGQDLIELHYEDWFTGTEKITYTILTAEGTKLTQSVIVEFRGDDFIQQLDIDPDPETITPSAIGEAYIEQGWEFLADLEETAYNSDDNLSASLASSLIVNYTPTAVADQYVAYSGKSLIGQTIKKDHDDDPNTPDIDVDNRLLANDSDPDNDILRVQLVSGPKHGSLKLSYDGSFEYIPDQDFIGVDTFLYQVNDGFLTDSATVTFHVEPQPLTDVTDLTFDSFLYGEVMTFDLRPKDEESTGHTALTTTILSQPDSGVLLPQADGTWVYEPKPGATGSVSFTFEVSNGHSSQTQTATIVLPAEPAASEWTAGTPTEVPTSEETTEEETTEEPSEETTEDETPSALESYLENLLGYASVYGTTWEDLPVEPTAAGALPEIPTDNGGADDYLSSLLIPVTAAERAAAVSLSTTTSSVPASTSFNVDLDGYITTSSTTTTTHSIEHDLNASDIWSYQEHFFQTTTYTTTFYYDPTHTYQSGEQAILDSSSTLEFELTQTVTTDYNLRVIENGDGLSILLNGSKIDPFIFSDPATDYTGDFGRHEESFQMSIEGLLVFNETETTTPDTGAPLDSNATTTINFGAAYDYQIKGYQREFLSWNKEFSNPANASPLVLDGSYEYHKQGYAELTQEDYQLNSEITVDTDNITAPDEGQASSELLIDSVDTSTIQTDWEWTYEVDDSTGNDVIDVAFDLYTYSSTEYQATSSLELTTDGDQEDDTETETNEALSSETYTRQDGMTRLLSQEETRYQLYTITNNGVQELHYEWDTAGESDLLTSDHFHSELVSNQTTIPSGATQAVNTGLGYQEHSNSNGWLLVQSTWGGDFGNTPDASGYIVVDGTDNPDAHASYSLTTNTTISAVNGFDYVSQYYDKPDTNTKIKQTSVGGGFAETKANTVSQLSIVTDRINGLQTAEMTTIDRTTGSDESFYASDDQFSNVTRTDSTKQAFRTKSQSSSESSGNWTDLAYGSLESTHNHLTDVSNLMTFSLYASQSDGSTTYSDHALQSASISSNSLSGRSSKLSQTSRYNGGGTIGSDDHLYGSSRMEIDIINFDVDNNSTIEEGEQQANISYSSRDGLKSTLTPDTTYYSFSSNYSRATDPDGPDVRLKNQSIASGGSDLTLQDTFELTTAFETSETSTDGFETEPTADPELTEDDVDTTLWQSSQTTGTGFDSSLDYVSLHYEDEDVESSEGGSSRLNSETTYNNLSTLSVDELGNARAYLFQKDRTEGTQMDGYGTNRTYDTQTDTGSRRDSLYANESVSARDKTTFTTTQNGSLETFIAAVDEQGAEITNPVPVTTGSMSVATVYDTVSFGSERTDYEILQIGTAPSGSNYGIGNSVPENSVPENSAYDTTRSDNTEMQAAQAYPSVVSSSSAGAVVYSGGQSYSYAVENNFNTVSTRKGTTQPANTTLQTRYSEIGSDDTYHYGVSEGRDLTKTQFTSERDYISVNSNETAYNRSIRIGSIDKESESARGEYEESTVWNERTDVLSTEKSRYSESTTAESASAPQAEATRASYEYNAIQNYTSTTHTDGITKPVGNFISTYWEDFSNVDETLLHLSSSQSTVTRANGETRTDDERARARLSVGESTRGSGTDSPTARYNLPRSSKVAKVKSPVAVVQSRQGVGDVRKISYSTTAQATKRYTNDTAASKNYNSITPVAGDYFDSQYWFGDTSLSGLQAKDTSYVIKESVHYRNGEVTYDFVDDVATFVKSDIHVISGNPDPNEYIDQVVNVNYAYIITRDRHDVTSASSSNLDATTSKPILNQDRSEDVTYIGIHQASSFGVGYDPNDPPNGRKDNGGQGVGLTETTTGASGDFVIGEDNDHLTNPGYAPETGQVVHSPGYYSTGADPHSNGYSIENAELGMNTVNGLIFGGDPNAPAVPNARAGGDFLQAGEGTNGWLNNNPEVSTANTIINHGDAYNNSEPAFFNNNYAVSPTYELTEENTDPVLTAAANYAEDYYNEHGSYPSSSSSSGTTQSGFAALGAFAGDSGNGNPQSTHTNNGSAVTEPAPVETFVDSCSCDCGCGSHSEGGEEGSEAYDVIQYSVDHVHYIVRDSSTQEQVGTVWITVEPGTDSPIDEDPESWIWDGITVEDYINGNYEVDIDDEDEIERIPTTHQEYVLTGGMQGAFQGGFNPNGPPTGNGLGNTPFLNNWGEIEGIYGPPISDPKPTFQLALLDDLYVNPYDPFTSEMNIYSHIVSYWFGSETYQSDDGDGKPEGFGRDGVMGMAGPIYNRIDPPDPYLFQRNVTGGLGASTYDSFYLGFDNALGVYTGRNALGEESPAWVEILTGTIDTVGVVSAKKFKDLVSTPKAKQELLKFLNKLKCNSADDLLPIIDNGFTPKQYSPQRMSDIANFERIRLQSQMSMRSFKDEIGPAISIGQDKVTGRLSHIHHNNMGGNIPPNLSPQINKRMSGVPHYQNTAGAGSHAEVYAADELLKSRPGAVLEELRILTIESKMKKYMGQYKPACPHCDHLLRGVEYIRCY